MELLGSNVLAWTSDARSHSVGRNSHLGEKGGGTSTDSFLLKNIQWLVLLVWSTVLQGENKYNDDFLDTEGI